MIIDAVIFMSEFRIVLYENDVNRRIVDLCFFGSSAQLPVCLLCQMIAFYNELLSLSKALSLAPENSSVLFYLGRCYSRLDLYDKALECFRKADALYPNDPDVTVMLGTVNMNRGNTVEAKGYYEKVLKMIEEKQVPVSSSTAVTVYVSYGHCLGRLGDKEAALKYFSLAKENGYSQSGIEPYCKELGLDPDLV